MEKLTEIELVLLKAMRLVCDRWFSSVYEISAPSIAVGHTLEGVRTNGSGQKATMLTAVRNFNYDFSNEIQTYKEVARDFHTMAALFYDYFKVCPECNGEQGTGVSGKLMKNGWPKEECWQDCCKCDGKGYVSKSKRR